MFYSIQKLFFYRQLYITDDTIKTMAESKIGFEDGASVYVRNPIDKKWYRGLIEDSQSMKVQII